MQGLASALGAKMRVARALQEKSNAKRAVAFEFLDEEFSDCMLNNVPCKCNPIASNLEEAIERYIDYGEGISSEIVGEIMEVKEIQKLFQKTLDNL